MKYNKAFTHSRECLFQGEMFYFLLEPHLQWVFTGVYFANTKLSEGWSGILSSKVQLIKFLEDSNSMFHRNKIDPYIEKQSCLF